MKTTVTTTQKTVRKRSKNIFLNWAKKQEFAQLIRGERSTLVIIRGLDNCSVAMNKWRKSQEAADNKLMDIAFRNYKLAIAIADFKRGEQQ